MDSSNSRMRSRSWLNRTKHSLSFLICGASSASHSPSPMEDHMAKSTARSLENMPPLNNVSLKSKEVSSSDCTFETGFSSSRSDNGASSESSDGIVEKSSAEFGLRNLETSSNGKCLSESNGLLPYQVSADYTPVEAHWEKSSDTGSITFKEKQSLESISADVTCGYDASLDASDSMNKGLSSIYSEDRPSSSETQEPENLCVVDDSVADAVLDFHSSDPGSVVSDSPETSPLLGDDSAGRLTPSRLGVIISDREQDSRNSSLHHVDMVSISSNILPSGISEISFREARRNSRRPFWDTFSRHSSRQHSDSPTVFFTTSHADDVGSHDRWLFDFSGDLHYGVGHDSRYSRSSRHRRGERRWRSRHEISERVHHLDDGGWQRSLCASGLHPDGTCSCGSLFTAEESSYSSIHASIFQVVMLADALFEVLDEIHHHPVPLSLPAPENVVDSFPLKKYNKSEATESGDQCYICLAEYEEGEKIRVLPCCHEYHVSCIDKWLKEIHSVCPVCRGDVCKGAAEASVSNPEI